MSVVWFNGYFSEGMVQVDAHDRGFLLGDGVFETIAVIDGVALWQAEHVQRMETAAVELGIPFDKEAVQGGVASVLQKSGGQMEVLRITLSRGVAGRGLAGTGMAPSLLITLDAFDAKNLFQPCRLMVSSIRRSAFAPSSRLKTLSYVDGVMAAREAAATADDALMLNTAGHVASSTVGNVFILKDGQLITPSATQGILPGIIRGLLLATSAKPVERIVLLEELFTADAVFLTNSLRFIRPVSHLNGEELVTGPLDGLKEILCRGAEKQCGLDPRRLT